MKRIQLSQYIEHTNNRNSDNTIAVVKGLSTKKEFRIPQSRVNINELRSYKIVNFNDFAFVPTTDTWRCLAIAVSKFTNPIVVSPIYCTFRIKSDCNLLPDYLYLWLIRPEMDRYARYHSWGSARENFKFEDMQRVSISLPSVENQQKLANLWKGLKEMAESNHAMSQPLMELCMSYLKEFQTQYPMKRLGDGLIERIERTNEDMKLMIEHVRGVSNSKEIIKTKADISKRDLRKFLVLNTHEFVYNRRTTRNGERLGMGFNEGKEALLFTEDYVAFRVSDTAVLLPEYLFLCFKRDEFDRYVRWDSWGSATEFFNWENMQQVKIPVPPLEKQQALVGLYKCARKCQQLARRAADLANEACPALVKKAKEM